MANDINSQISAHVQSFVTELTALVRSAALEAVQSVLGGSAAPAKRGPGRPKAAAAKPAKAAATGKPKRRAKGARRSSEDVDATAVKFFEYVTANDGKRLEEISKALGIHTADLKLPAQKLIAAKAVRTTGQKRGTKYHVAGKASKPKRAMKA
jgi:hypothetical protein